MRGSRPFVVHALAVCAITLSACERPTAPEAMRMADDATRDVATGGRLRESLPGAFLLRWMPQASTVAIRVGDRVEDHRAAVVEKVFVFGADHVGPTPPPRRYLLAWRGDTTLPYFPNGTQISVAVGWAESAVDSMALAEPWAELDGPSRSLAHYIPADGGALFRGTRGSVSLSEQHGSSPCRFVQPHLEGSVSRWGMPPTPEHLVTCHDGDYDVELDIRLVALVLADSTAPYARQRLIVGGRSLHLGVPATRVRGYRFTVRCPTIGAFHNGCEASPYRVHRYFCEHPQQDPLAGRRDVFVDRCALVLVAMGD